jgi:hypothetical protein
VAGNPIPAPVSGPVGALPAIVPRLTTAASQVLRGTWVSAGNSVVPEGGGVSA